MYWPVLRITENQTAWSPLIIRVIFENLTVENGVLQIGDGDIFSVSFLFSVKAEFILISFYLFSDIMNIHLNYFARHQPVIVQFSPFAARFGLQPWDWHSWEEWATLVLSTD